MSKIKMFSLGGLNESGKNMFVIEINKIIFIFDAGLKHMDSGALGVDYVIPKTDYLKENINRIKGIFLTHGHYENMGAVYDLVKSIKEQIFRKYIMKQIY